MSILDRINNKLSLKQRSYSEQPPNSELILLVGREEAARLKELMCSVSLAEIGRTLSPEEIEFDGRTTFVEMMVIPVDFDEYLDIVRKL